MRTPLGGSCGWAGREIFLISGMFFPKFSWLSWLLFSLQTEEKWCSLARGEPLVLGAQHLLQTNKQTTKKREMFQHCQLLPWVPPCSSSSLFVDHLFRNILQLESGLPAKYSPLSCRICYSELGFVFFLSRKGGKNRKKGVKQQSDAKRTGKIMLNCSSTVSFPRRKSIVSGSVGGEC